MIDIKTKVKSKDKKTIERLLKLKDGYVKIGWNKDDRYENGTYVAEVAFFNENGFTIHHKNGTVTPVPPRQFLKFTMAKNSKNWFTYWKDTIKQYLDGKKTLKMALERLGLIVKIGIQNTIISNVPPPNAESTLRRKKAKGSPEITLWDSGTMFNKIGLEIHEGKEK